MVRNWTPPDDEQLDREIEDARKRSKIADASEPRAVSARYNRRTRRIDVELADGWLFGFPANSAPGLQGATPTQLAEVEVMGDGYALHWQSLDADFTVAGLLQGHFGSRAGMREPAQRGDATAR